MALDLVGQVFGRLTVLEKGKRKYHGYITWRCVCQCGKRRTISGGSLRSGNTRSCGCLHSEAQRENIKKARAAKYGTAAVNWSAEELAMRAIWYGMKGRCYKETNRSFADYGGRGIVICDEWRDDWQAFARDMPPRPSAKHSIDRIDNDQGYSPGNCRWATNHEQSSNRRNAHRVLVDGEVVPLAVVARREGISTARARYLLKLGRYYPPAAPTLTSIVQGEGE